VCAVDGRSEVAHESCFVWILQQRTEHVAAELHFIDRPDVENEAEGFGARPKHVESLRKATVADEETSRAIASPAAVASSSSDALATSIAVRSVTIVWKLINDSSRPCAISAWYGVYGVYQPGFSITIRRITLGVTVS
jgi:hypothetical protein